MKIIPGHTPGIPLPGKHPEYQPPVDPEDRVFQQENPDIIPDEDPFDTPPPYEIPLLAEGP